MNNLKEYYPNKSITKKSNYQDTKNIYKYLKIMTNLKKINNLCIPEFITEYNGKRLNTIILIDVINNFKYYADDLDIKISNCKDRFSYFSLLLKDKEIHNNIVIIDNKKKTIERFEPYGWIKKNSFFLEKQKQIDEFMVSELIPFIKLKKYKYINPNKIYNKVGIQYVADSYCGMCVTICVMYLHLRLINPDSKQKSVVNHFMKKKDLKEKILKYANYIQKKII